jgi:hypothetical protein
MLMIPESPGTAIARCQACGAAFSEAAVLAMAPVCNHCGAVTTGTGGTLGLTGAYGVGDPTITRARNEADLRVMTDFQEKYRGMIEASRDQLTWGVEKYAKFSAEPELLQLEPVPSALEILGWDQKGDFRLAVTFLFIVAIVIFWLWVLIGFNLMHNNHLILGLPIYLVGWVGGLASILLLPFYLVSLLIGLVSFVKAKVSNGSRPHENVRRQKVYEQACAEALKAAEPTKAAQDYRLRLNIRDAEASLKTLTEKSEAIRRLQAQ